MSTLTATILTGFLVSCAIVVVLAVAVALVVLVVRSFRREPPVLTQAIVEGPEGEWTDAALPDPDPITAYYENCSGKGQPQPMPR